MAGDRFREPLGEGMEGRGRCWKSGNIQIRGNIQQLSGHKKSRLRWEVWEIFVRLGKQRVTFLGGCFTAIRKTKIAIIVTTANIFKHLCARHCSTVLSGWFSKCGPWTCVFSITWECVRKANSQAPPQRNWVRNWGDCGAAACVLASPLWFSCVLKSENCSKHPSCTKSCIPPDSWWGKFHYYRLAYTAAEPG